MLKLVNLTLEMICGIELWVGMEFKKEILLVMTFITLSA